MQIVQKLMRKAYANDAEPPVTIAFLGDSITQGCFEVCQVNENQVKTVFDKNNVYHNYLARILNILYPTVPINIINAGISGDSARKAVGRLERDVLRFSPDMTVVCFGLNDCSRGQEGLQDYKNSLEYIFKRLKDINSEIIFMTPNMMSTEVRFYMSDSYYKEIAEEACKNQNQGILDMYLNTAKQLCEKHEVTICDCYEKWKLLSQCGVNVSDLLVINHPIREMHWLFATSLVETMLK